MKSKFKNKIFASSTLGVQLFLLIALTGSIYGFWLYGIDLTIFVIFIFGYFLYACLGIIVTFHRNLSHRSYQTNKWLERLTPVVQLFGWLFISIII